MPETFQALAVLTVALLPGALYVWAFERLAGAWEVRFSDRLLRFLGVSALLHAAFAPLSYWLWIEFVRSGRLAASDVSIGLWAVPLGYVAVPILAGSLVGGGTRKQARWAKLFTGPQPAPRAWDHLFASRPDGWIRLRLKSGVWLGGAYATLSAKRRSYASGFPEDQDLFLVEGAQVDPETGEFAFDEDGKPIMRLSGILIRWSEVEYLEFIEA